MPGYDPDFLAVQVHEFDVSDHRELLVPGNNVLAVHGLNNIRKSQDFFLAPELVGTETLPDPGAQNPSYLTITAVEESAHIGVRRGNVLA